MINTGTLFLWGVPLKAGNHFWLLFGGDRYPPMACLNGNPIKDGSHVGPYSEFYCGGDLFSGVVPGGRATSDKSPQMAPRLDGIPVIEPT